MREQARPYEDVIYGVFGVMGDKSPMLGIEPLTFISYLHALLCSGKAHLHKLTKNDQSTPSPGTIQEGGVDPSLRGCPALTCDQRLPLVTIVCGEASGVKLSYYFE